MQLTFGTKTTLALTCIDLLSLRSPVFGKSVIRYHERQLVEIAQVG